ncbi:RDD family protein [Rhodococcus ruber]|uniref:RDD family protein n=1 Tax=Rhodococcus ruber TaxID=1830 RepID=UPI00387DD01C
MTTGGYDPSKEPYNQGGEPDPQQGGYPPPPGSYPPPGNYPPPQGNYPPAGGYPPPQGNYPPPGGYPPPPGNYPPQGGYSTPPGSVSASNYGHYNPNQEAPGGYPVPPSSGPGGRQPGDLLTRFGARLVDHLIVGIPTFAVSAILWFTDNLVLNIVGAVLLPLALFGYFVYFESTKGWTPGKKLLGLTVLGPGGRIPTSKESATRNAFLLIGALTSIPFLGWLFSLLSLAAYIVIAITIQNSPTKQGLHDQMAGGTQVSKN